MKGRPLGLLFLAGLSAVSLVLCLFPALRSDPCAAYDGRDFMLTGRVVQKHAGGSLDIRAEGVAGTVRLYPPKEQSGEALAWDVTPSIGQTVRVRGRISALPAATSPGMFDGVSYYRTLGVAFRLFATGAAEVSGEADAFREGLYTLRAFLGGMLEEALGAEDAGIMKAMLLGDKSALDDDTKLLYQQSGILHILTVSGLHITLLGTALYRLLVRCRLPFIVASCLTVGCMIVYGLMCGMGMSAARALAMFALRLFAERTGRSYDLPSAMSLVGLLLLFEQPLYARNSGFLFSFGSLAALSLAEAPARERGIAARLRRLFLPGMLIALVTLPVYLCFYFSYPLYGLLVNPMVIPLAGVMLPCGVLLLLSAGLAALSGVVLFALPAALFAFLIRGILALYEALCTLTARLPFSHLTPGAPALWQVALYYLLLGFALRLKDGSRGERTSRMRVQRVRRLRIPARTAVGAACIFSALLCILWRPLPYLSIACLDVGQGDGIVVRHREYSFLIDGGSTSVSEAGRYRILPYLRHEGIPALDAVFVSHEDEDHVNGILELMDDMARGGLPIRHLYLPETGRDVSELPGDRYTELVVRARALGIPVTVLHAGQRLTAGELSFLCLGPSASGVSGYAENANAHSMILHLSCGAFSALFTGDVEGEGLIALNRVLASLPVALRRVDVLKVAHHGSRFTTDETFLSLTDARIALISCGRRNRYGHPHEELLGRLAVDGSDIFTTPRCGTITVRADRGGGMRVIPFLPAGQQE